MLYETIQQRAIQLVIVGKSSSAASGSDNRAFTSVM
jgi:hypothetical protein